MEGRKVLITNPVIYHFENKGMEKGKKIYDSYRNKTYFPINSDTRRKLALFERYMESRRYSSSTICSYLMNLKMFFGSFCGKNWDQVCMKDVEAYNWERYIDGDASSSAQNQFISALKLFYRFNKVDDLVPDDIERPFRERTLPNVLTKNEVKRIILSCNNLKHRCLLSLVYGVGLRIGEALDLRISDIRSQEGLIYIRSAKGKKDRRVPLSQALIKMLREYWYAYKPQEYLFEGIKGGKYSYRSAQQFFQAAVKKSGIKIKVKLHTLRHSYATHLMESGVGLRYIQELLGHNSPKTTMIYTHVSGKKLNELKSPFDDLNI